MGIEASGFIRTFEVLLGGGDEAFFKTFVLNILPGNEVQV